MSKEIGSYLVKADKANERAKLTVFHCNLPTPCPLLAKGQCINASLFSRCVHGSVTTDTTPSKRSKSYYSEFKQLEAAQIKIGKAPKPPTDATLTVLGDWVYLPYTHMNHLDGKGLGIPFERYSSIFSNGSDFMKRADFTPETIIKILKLRPMAIMGGEISQYQQQEVPRFVLHLSKLMPGLFQEVAKEYPRIVEILNTVLAKEIPDFEAPIKLIPPATSTGFRICKDSRILMWDGEVLRVAVKAGTYFFAACYIKSKPDSETILEFTPTAEMTAEIFGTELKKLITDQHPEYLKVK